MNVMECTERPLICGVITFIRRYGIKIQQLSTEYERNEMNKENSCYYLYNVKKKYGYFTKILFENECKKMITKGYKVYFIKKVKMKKQLKLCPMKNLLNMKIPSTNRYDKKLFNFKDCIIVK